MVIIEMKDTPQEVYRKMQENHSCRSCGQCCVNPMGMLPDEVMAVAAFLKMDASKLLSEYLVDTGGRGGDPLLKRPKKVPYEGKSGVLKGRKVCVFLQDDEDGNPSCSVYRVRPFMCRLQFCNMSPETRDGLIKWSREYYRKEMQNDGDRGLQQ